MSTTIDERVVEMQFNNSQFEKNVETSLGTIDKLKNSLNFTGASKGLESVNDAAKKVDMSTLGNAVETVQAKFSAFQVMAVTTLANITNASINAGKRIAASLTITPIKTGFQEYETQLNSVQTILANTESKGTTLDQVNKALDELNLYADKTIYNFTQMTKNIGTFTAAGVDLDMAVSSIKGIANLAAVSGSTSTQASTAMYQLSQAIATGTVRLMDWNSVVNAGMGGELFQNALKRTAEHMGKDVDGLIKKYGSFRESLTHGGWLTVDVLTETLAQLSGAYTEADLIAQGYTEEQAKDIYKLSQTAVDAATKVKTFTQLMDTTREAAQSGWAQTWEILIGDFGAAKELWTSVSDVMNKIISDSAEARNSLLSGALSTGWRQLIDAGISDEEGYKEIIQSVAKEHGIAFDEMIEKEGSFEKALTAGLKDGSMTADMLTTSVTKLADKMRGMSDEERRAAGYTDEHIKTIEELDKGLKDGTISMDEFVKKMTRASGRENVIEALGNAFKGLMSVITPIKEAFRDIFPRMQAEQLYNFTERLLEFSKRLTLSEENSAKLKDTFRGLFSIIKMGIDVVKIIAKGILSMAGHLSGLGDKVLDVTSKIGKWFDGLRESNVINEKFGKGMGVVVEEVGKFMSKIKERVVPKGWEAFLGVMEAIWEVLQQIGSTIAGVIYDIGSAFANAIKVDNLSEALSVLNSFLTTGIIGMLFKAVHRIGGIDSLIDQLADAFDNLTHMVQVEILWKLAGAIALLAASLLILSSVDPQKLAGALAAITGLFANLMGSMAVFNKLGFSGLGKTFGLLTNMSTLVSFLISLSIAILILAGAMKSIAELDTGDMIKGLGGILGMTAILVGAAKVLETNSKAVFKGAGQMILMAIALKILASVCKDLSAISWEDLKTGLVTIGILLAELNAFLFFAYDTDFGASTGIGLVFLAAAIKILASALKDMSTLSLDEIGRGLLAMGGGLAAITLAMLFMPKQGMVGIGVGLAIVSASLLLISKAIESMGGLSWKEIGKGIATLAASMLILSVSLHFMTGTLAGSAALLVAVASFGLLVPILKALGSIKVSTIAKGLLTIAGVFVILGAAGLLLAPLVPSILSLSASLALLGISCLAIGAGLSLIAAGFTSLAVAAGAGATAIVAAISAIVLGIVGLIPAIVVSIGQGVVSLLEVIASMAPALSKAIIEIVKMLVDVLVDCAPMILAGILELATGLLRALIDFTPKLVEVIVGLLITLIESIGKYIPEILKAAIKVFADLFSGLTEALGSLDSSTIINTIIGVGLFSVLLYALGAVASLIPSAMIGVIGLGILVTELGLVLAAIGLISKIPGLNWLIEEGGSFLQTIGTAIGQFVGGIVGGFAEGATSTLPQVGTNLSNFMVNATPFLEGCKNMGESALNGAKALAQTILILTAADVLQGLTSFITGGNSLTEFGKEIAEFGKYFKTYANEVVGIDGAAVESSANAALALAKFADNIPNTGGLVAKITGENSIAAFAKELVPFGGDIKKYADSVIGIDAAAIESSANAALALTEFADNIPNNGGWLGKITGENSLADFASEMVTFGKKFKEYSDAVSGINFSTLTNAITSLRAFINVAKSASDVNFTGINAFANSLEVLGNAAVDKFIAAFTNATERVAEAGGNMFTSLTKGMESKKSTVTKTMQKIIEAIFNLIKKQASKFTSIGKESIVKFAKGVNDGGSTVKNSVKTLLNAAIAVMQSLYTRFEYTGKYLVQGFADGITKYTFMAEAKAKAMAEAALKAARRALDVNSPSKEFEELGKQSVAGFSNALSSYKIAVAKGDVAGIAAAKEAIFGAMSSLKTNSPSKEAYEIGGYVGQGLVNGIRDYATSVYQAGYDVADAAKNGLSKAIAKVCDLVETGMDTQPTIRPVLDLSDVAAGADSINNMFGMTPSVGVLSNVGSISSMMNGIQNGGNDDIISAIKDLGNTLSGLSGDNYQINGVTYDDGSNIVGAVKEIIRAAKVERRV